MAEPNWLQTLGPKQSKVSQNATHFPLFSSVLVPSLDESYCARCVVLRGRFVLVGSLGGLACLETMASHKHATVSDTQIWKQTIMCFGRRAPSYGS